MTGDPDQARAARYPAILAALQEAAAGRSLRVEPQADLYGASVIGPLVEAYVIATHDGGVQVDLWRHDGNDPYRIVHSQDLPDAVRLAVTEASAPGRFGGREPPASEHPRPSEPVLRRRTTPKG